MNATIRNSFITAACMWLIMYMVYQIGHIMGSSDQRKYDKHHIAELIMELEKDIMKDSSTNNKGVKP